MATAIPDEAWARIQAEHQRIDAQRQKIRAQIMLLLPPESDQTPPLTRDDLLRVLLCCQQLDRLGEWPGWCEAVKLAALVRYQQDSGVAAVLRARVAPLYQRDPGDWDAE